MIAIFSGLWPYTKQLISLLMWVIDPSFISCKQRGKILHWLDLLGKWSMVRFHRDKPMHFSYFHFKSTNFICSHFTIVPFHKVDVFVLLTTLASFRITIQSPSHVAYLPEGFYKVDMMVVPLW